MRISDWSSDVCSSDLVDRQCAVGAHLPFDRRRQPAQPSAGKRPVEPQLRRKARIALRPRDEPHRLQRQPGIARRIGRSEEHTSELQSLMRTSYAVFCLKKKTAHHSTLNPPDHTHYPKATPVSQ